MKTLIAAAAALAATALAPVASAANYSLYLHGLTAVSGYSVPSGWQYWTGGQAGINAVPVNYDGTVHVSQSNPTVRSALNAYCRGTNKCYVAAHSMGAAQIGYAVANYGGTYSAPTWNIIWVDAGGSAAGGSELANAADWLLGSSGTQGVLGGAVYDLQTSVMRGLYNHDSLGNIISGKVYTFLGGDWSSFDTCFFPGGGTFCSGGGGGGNDRAVAYHSSGHYRSVGNYGSASASGSSSSTYWNYTVTSSVEDSTWGSHTHFNGDSNGGIMGTVISDMSTYAN